MDLFTDSDITELRDLAASALPDTGTITRPSSGAGTIDGSGVWTPAAPATIYTGQMRIKSASMRESEIVFGDTVSIETRYIVTLPHTAAAVTRDDRLTVTTSADTLITDTPFRVAVVIEGSYNVQRRIGVEAVE